MLIPQFSIRWLLAVTAVFAAICSIFGLAFRQNPSQWAVGVSIALVSLAILLLVHAFVFWLVWVFSITIGQRSLRIDPTGVSPFKKVPAPVEKEEAATPIILD